MKKMMALLSAAALFLSISAVPAYAEETVSGNSHIIVNGPLADEEDIRVIVQPQSQTYSYPDPVTLHLEVDHPEKIVSYQWVMTDEYRYYELDGESAHTDTLVLASTQFNYGSEFYWCVMRDTEGNYIYSDEAELKCSNPDERFPFMYITDYALMPGESMDLSEYDLGSGTIRLDENGHDITFDHVHFNNDSPAVYDSALRPATAIMVFDRSAFADRYTIDLVGDCVIDNCYFDPEINSGGVSLSAFFAVLDNDRKPDLLITGDGKLKVTGGLRTINTDGNVIIDTDTRLENRDGHYCHGLYGNNVAITSGHILSIETAGDGIVASNVLIVQDGARVEYKGAPPHLPGAPTSTSAISAEGNMYIDAADIEINGHVSRDEFMPYDIYHGAYNGLWCAGTLYLNGSTVNIDLSADETGDNYAIGFFGMRGTIEGNIVIDNGSQVNIRMESADIIASSGILATGTISVTGGSTLNIKTRGRENIYGLNSETGIELRDSDIDIRTESQGAYYDVQDCAGIFTPEIVVDYTDSQYSLHVNAIDGTAFVIGSDGTLEGPQEYTPGYEPQRFFLGNQTVISVPLRGEVNSSWHEFPVRKAIETVYDTSDFTPAAEAVITSGKARFTDVQDPERYYYDPVYWALENDITTGTGPTTFEPDAKVTRGQIVTFLYRAAGEPEVSGDMPFTDVAEDKYFYDAVLWALENNITVGTSPDKFSPNDRCTRAQVVTFLYRYAGEPEVSGTTPFKDVPADAYYKDAVAWAYENGITTGTSAVKFSPDGSCTRGQAVTFLYRAMNQEK